jgi:hypothetical protein
MDMVVSMKKNTCSNETKWFASDCITVSPILDGDRAIKSMIKYSHHQQS